LVRASLIGPLCLNPEVVVSELRTVVVLDYQNMHLSGYELYRNFDRDRPVHKTLLDPSRFASALLDARNRAQRPGHPTAVLSRVEAFRGCPIIWVDGRRTPVVRLQQENWQRDPRVTVKLRPLRYEPASAGKLKAIEKGIDVLCALALLRLARRDDLDLVILASHDSDLKPALDEAIDLRAAKIETCAWVRSDRGPYFRQLSPTVPRRVWHTRLEYADFKKSFDPTEY
jgi:uncharacterized LabA/DUF88 family protein